VDEETKIKKPQKKQKEKRKKQYLIIRKNPGVGETRNVKRHHIKRNAIYTSPDK
jgi:hypothetical protein